MDTSHSGRPDSALCRRRVVYLYGYPRISPRNANRRGFYTPDYEWGEWNIKDKPIRYLTDDEDQKILKELDPSAVKDPKHKKGRQAARDIFVLMVDGGFRINEASVLKWSDVDFDNGVIYLYRSKVSNDDFVPMTKRLRMALLNRRKSVDGEYVFPGRFGGHKTIQNNRALETAFRRAGVTDVSSHNLRKTFATRLLSRGAASHYGRSASVRPRFCQDNREGLCCIRQE